MANETGSTQERRRKNGGVETVRVQFSLPASLVQDIDEYCERAHMLRSTFVEYTLASSLASSRDLTKQVADTLGTLGMLKELGGE